MNSTQRNPVSIAAGKQSSKLSKGQKLFNRLIMQIEAKRARIAAWEEITPAYHRKYDGELQPLTREATALQATLVRKLDHASGAKGLSKAERRKISGVITNLAGDLAAVLDDDELKAIYNKHSGSDLDAEAAANMAGMKSMFEDVLGFDLGDDVDMSSPEAMLERAQAQMLKEEAQFEAREQARQERLRKRKKSPKQLAEEARRENEAKQLSQSIREVYRKLASALHPDRETDPAERERKTILMQRANQAYEKNNLLQLLELQLELEHIDQHAINNIGEDRLKHYNTILHEQLEELDMEAERVSAEFMMRFGISPFKNVVPANAMRELAVEIVSVQQSIRALKKDLLVFDDTTKLKSWLRYVPHMQRNNRDDFPF